MKRIQNITFCLVIVIFSFLSSSEALALSKKSIRKEQKLENQCKYDLSVCAMFQDEGPYLKEWIEYYRLLGVQHFYLYNDSSRDNFMDVLQTYIDQGIVDLIHWKRNLDKRFSYAQYNVYNHCIKKSYGVSRWITLIDIDEFILPMHCDNLIQFLNEYENYAGIFIPWLHFGTSGVEKVKENELTIERLTMREKTMSTKPTFGKSIFKPHRVRHKKIRPQDSFHRPLYKKGYQEKDFIPYGLTPDQQIRINHYWTRDIWYLMNIKKPRIEKYLGKKLTPYQIQNHLARYNDIEDTEILRFVTKLKDRMFSND